MVCAWEGFPNPGCGRSDVTKARPRVKQAGEGGRVLRLSGPWAAVKARTIRPLMTKQERTGTRKAGKVGPDSQKDRGREWEWEVPKKGLPQEVGLERSELGLERWLSL